MTESNPALYGTPWLKCSKCGVSRPEEALSDGACIDVLWCNLAEVWVKKL